MTPARPATKLIPALLAVVVLVCASFAIAQLQAPDQKPSETPPPKETPTPVETAHTQPDRTGEAQAAPAEGAPQPDATVERQAEEGTTPAKVEEAKQAAPATTSPPQTPPGKNAEQTKAESQGTPPASEETKAVPPQKEKETAAATGKVAPQEMSAFIEALRAAERTNENLTKRLAELEASAALQRDRDQAFIRDMIRGVLLLSGGMAALGMFALVAIVYLQIRSSKQQAIAFAAQLQALNSQVALPGPGGSAHAALRTSKNHFDSTARNIEQKLSDLESMASGLPGSAARAEVHDQDVHAGAVSAQNASDLKLQPQSRGETLPDLLAKANSLLMQQQPEVALAYLDQAVGRDPGNVDAHLRRGSTLERLNRLEEALGAYDLAIRAEPSLPAAFLAKAGVLNKLQRYGEALKCYEVALANQGGQSADESPAA